MSKRNYNIFFNTHTVSGIVVSVALYIIFFAGAFALFKEEIDLWEEGGTVSKTEHQNIDFDNILEQLDRKHELIGRDIQLNFGAENDKISVFMSTSKDSLTLEKGTESHYYLVDIHSGDTQTYPEYYGLGEFLYRLHFFAQIPTVGIYLAGIVSLLFLFAIVTGLIVHWKKIIPNFYKFNPKASIKRIWTDSHTALGVLGVPFQLIFAITGAYFGLSVLVLLPGKILYDGDQNKMMEDLRPTRKSYEWQARADDEVPSFNYYVRNTAQKYENFHLTRGYIKNYGGRNMKIVVNGELATSERYVGAGSITYDAYTGVVESEKDPNKLSYIEDVQFVLGRLHFADFGGLTMKIIYFILALITCFVIITGVLIYVEARNKKSKTLKQRLYTAKVGHIYLAICLSMLPVTAVSFLFVKIAHGYFVDKQTTIYWFYFITWFVAIVYFRLKRDNYHTNKMNLLLGAVFGFLVPIVNGIVSGNWLWKTFSEEQFDVLLIDLLWIGIAITSLLFYLNIKPQIKEKSTFAKRPIDYKNLNKSSGIAI